MIEYITNKTDPYEVVAKQKLLLELIVNPQIEKYSNRYNTNPHSVVLLSDDVSIIINPDKLTQVFAESTLIQFDTMSLLDNDGELVLVIDDEEFTFGYLSNSKASKLGLDDVFENDDFIILEDDLDKLKKSLSVFSPDFDNIFE